MCEQLKKQVDEAIIKEADATNLPFPDQSFDGVFGVSILHHIRECDMANGDKEPNDRKKVWSEIARVLRPNGWFAFCEPNAYNPFTKFVQWRFGEDSLTCSEMMRDAEQVGLKIIDYGTLQFCSPRTMWVTKIPLWNAFERLVERFGLGVSAYVVGTK
jgi:SAM-dependent methyltransferase